MALRTPFANDAKTYGFEWLRGLLEAGLQEGVLNMGGAGTDFKVTAAAAGLLRVDVAAGAALIKGDSGTAALGLTQGLFMAVNDASIANAATHAAADATNPRIDQIVLKIEDSGDLGSAADQATIVVVAGTATSGATLDNRNGAAALPSNCLRLADVLIPATATAVLAANVRDRRPWARGAYRRIARTANAAAGSDYTTTATSAAQIDGTNLAPRIECSGAPLRVALVGGWTHGTTGGLARFQLRVDAAQSEGQAASDTNVSLGNDQSTGASWDFVPTAGSHVLSPYYWTGAGTLTLRAQAGQALELIIEELARPNADNT